MKSKAKNIQCGLVDTLGRKNRTIEDKPCEICGKVFRPVDSKKRTCSRSCGYKIRILIPHNKNVSNGWVDSKGYRQIKINGKNIREHRYIMERHLNRKLNIDEDVHHINECKTDNRIENLQLISHSNHTVLTHTGRRKAAIKKATL